METNLVKKIDQYIQLVYSEKSEMNAIQNLDERKLAACEKLKLDHKDDKIRQIIDLQEDTFSQKIIQHLITQNSTEYALLIADEHYLWELLHKLMLPLEEKDDPDQYLKTLSLKNKVSENADAVLSRVKDRRLSIFKGEREAQAAQEKTRTMRYEDRLKKKQDVQPNK